MKGRVLHWSQDRGIGMLLGEDGLQRSFTRADLVETEQVPVGSAVIFEVQAGADETSGQASMVRALEPVAAASTAIRVVITDVRVPFSSVLRITLQVLAIVFVVSLLLAILFQKRW